MDNPKQLEISDDRTARLVALNYSQVINCAPNGYPEDAVKMARQIYLFLTGKDPVCDLGLPEEGDGDTGEVIIFDGSRFDA